MQKLLEVQPSAAITAEELHYARRERVVQQLLDLDELLQLTYASEAGLNLHVYLRLQLNGLCAELIQNAVVIGTKAEIG